MQDTNPKQDSFQKLNLEISNNLIFYTSNLETIRKFDAMQEKVKESLIELNLPLKDFEFEELKSLTRINALLTISILDLMVSIKGISNSSVTRWEQIFFIKQCYLTIHETIKQYDKLHNRKFGELVNSKYPLIKNQLASFQKDLRSFKRDHENKLRHIRNKVSGHIDEDFITYYDALLGLKNQDPIQIVSSFIGIISKIQYILTTLLLSSNQNLEDQKINLTRKTEMIKNQIETYLTKDDKLSEKNSLKNLLQMINQLLKDKI